MKRLICCIILSVAICSCAPWHENPVSEYSLNALESSQSAVDLNALESSQAVVDLNALESSQAVVEWKKTLEETDNCSSPGHLGWLAEIFLDKNWDDCCYQHDFDYREGSKYGITKKQADYELWQCIDASGHPYIANIVYDSLVIFGGSSYQTH